MQQYVLSTICMVSKWEDCSEQNTQDPGRWERCMVSKVDYEVVESIQRETEQQLGTDSSREGSDLHF